MKSKILFLAVTGLFITSEAQAGSDISKVVTGGILGALTGGVSLLLGATATAAATAGVATAIGVAANQRTNVGVEVNGNGQPQGVYADVITRDGVQVARTRAGQGFETPPPPPQPTFQMPNVDAEQRREESERAKAMLLIDAAERYNFGTTSVNGQDYCWRKGNGSELFALANGRKWRTSTYNGFDAFSTFTSANNDERLAMRSFVFEKTPLAWKFNRVLLDNNWYNHAFTNTGLDIMVPEGETKYIRAPKWYTKQRKSSAQQHRNSNMSLVPDKNAVEGYFTESLWGIYMAYQNAQQMNFLDINQTDAFTNQGRAEAEAAMSYYDQAMNAATQIGSLAFDWAVAFAVPGGWQNLQEFAQGTRTAEQFFQNIAADIGPDLVAAGAGGFGGFSSRIAKTTIRVARARRRQARTRNNNASHMREGRGRSGARREQRTTETVRANRRYGEGRFWEGLIGSRAKPGSADKMSTRSQKYSARTNKQTKFDEHGFAYQFDPAHKLQKVHLHKYKRLKGDKFKLIEEVDPETGETISFKNGKIEQW